MDRTRALQNNPGKRWKWEKGRASGPALAESRCLGSASLRVRGAAKGRRRLSLGVLVAPKGRSSQAGFRDRLCASGRVFEEGRGLTQGVGKVARSWGLGSCGSESQFRDGGVEEEPEVGCQEPQARELSWIERCVLCVFDSVREMLLHQS